MLFIMLLLHVEEIERVSIISNDGFISIWRVKSSTQQTHNNCTIKSNYGSLGSVVVNELVSFTKTYYPYKFHSGHFICQVNEKKHFYLAEIYLAAKCLGLLPQNSETSHGDLDYNWRLD